MMSDQPPPSVHAPPVDFTEAAFARQVSSLSLFLDVFTGYRKY